MPIQIQYRRGTAAQWSSANPLLAAGEPGYETDTGKFKVGDGSTNWNSLSYSSGIQGTAGFVGTNGSQGLQGVIGSQGTQGTQGTQGIQGLDGAFVAQGNTGTQGVQGIQGTEGLQGIQGTNGIQGITGSQGIQGTTGTQGTTGSQGTDGTQGTQGVQGIQGTTGTQGTTGSQGLTGTQGTQGVQGIQGTQGLQGIQGIKGTADGAITFIVDGGGSVITTGIKGYVEVPFACTITKWTVLNDVSGSITFDIWKDTYANYPPTVADTITASAKPLTSSATKGQSATLTGWTTSLSAGDILAFNVDSATTVKSSTIILSISKA